MEDTGTTAPGLGSPDVEKSAVAIVTTVFHTDIDQVWNALVDPKLIAQYMLGMQLATDWEEGSPITWEGVWNGRAAHACGRVLQVRHPDLLKYTHIDTTTQAPLKHTITVELKPVAGTTHLRLTQDNNASLEAARESEVNWTAILDGMKRALGEAPVKKPEESRV